MKISQHRFIDAVTVSKIETKGCVDIVKRSLKDLATNPDAQEEIRKRRVAAIKLVQQINQLKFVKSVRLALLAKIAMGKVKYQAITLKTWRTKLVHLYSQIQKKRLDLFRRTLSSANHT